MVCQLTKVLQRNSFVAVQNQVMIASKTILFITGAYVSHACWNNWKTFFEQKGFTTIAPPWPGKNASAETLRNRHPDKVVADLTMTQVVSHYAHIAGTLAEKPIVIGHSFGGLFAQVLLNRGLAAAAVAIHAVPPQGIFPYELNFLRSNAPLLGFFTSLKKTYLMPFQKWQFVFTNGMSAEEQKDSYYELVIPESKRTARGGLTRAAYVDFKKEHAPLLLLAGSEDHCIPAHLCQRVYKSYKAKNSITDFIVKKRNHNVLGLATWQEDAAFIVEWLDKL